jgi:hypothetical protein
VLNDEGKGLEVVGIAVGKYQTVIGKECVIEGHPTMVERAMKNTKKGLSPPLLLPSQNPNWTKVNLNQWSSFDFRSLN